MNISVQQRFPPAAEIAVNVDVGDRHATNCTSVYCRGQHPPWLHRRQRHCCILRRARVGRRWAMRGPLIQFAKALMEKRRDPA